MFLKVLGYLCLLKYGWSFSQFLWVLTRLYLLPRFGMKKDLKKYGSWAVITGATDGIGKAVAKQIAKRGINVVLISRSVEKLSAVADEFSSFGVEVKTIAYDFNDVDNYEVIEKELKDLEIGILVNNVGIGYDHPSYFLEISGEFSDTSIKVNCTSVHKMSRIVLAGMSERKKGLIVHIASASGLRPVPLLSLYAATKAFVVSFSRGLHYEYASSGIQNQVIAPNFVATKLSKMRASGVFVPSADHFASSAVDTFGLTTHNLGCWGHELANYVFEALPDCVYYSQVLKMMVGGRKKWLRKQEQKRD